MPTNDPRRIPAGDAVLKVRVPPEAWMSRTAREGVAGFLRAYRVGDDDAELFLTALGEALANALEHARSTEAILAEVRIGTGRIVATVQDSGVGFEPHLLPLAVLPDIDAERGRGLAIMRRCCDIFAITSEPGKGTAVVIGRFLDRALSDIAC